MYSAIPAMIFVLMTMAAVAEVKLESIDDPGREEFPLDDTARAAGVDGGYTRSKTISTISDSSGSSEPNSQSIREIKAPAQLGSKLPSLFVSSAERVYMSWLGPGDSKRFALRFSVWDGKRWSKSRKVADSSNWFVNWADIPSLVVFRDGTLAAHWLRRSGGGIYGYDINIVTSQNGGRSWSDIVVPHKDGAKVQHGFVSMLPSDEGRLLVVWLDGAGDAETYGSLEAGALGGEVALKFASLSTDGTLLDEKVLDSRTCSCCRTDIASTEKGPIVVYRDRTDKEIRDISYLRYHNGKWSQPRQLHNDGWVIPGCPVNGPAVDARGEEVVVAWFTAANQEPSVKIAFSRDSGESFGPPVRVDGGDPAGRVDVVLLPGGDAVVSWLEWTRQGDNIRFRRVTRNGDLGNPRTLSLERKVRAGAFPQMSRSGDDVLFAWTQQLDMNRTTLRTAVVKLRKRIE